MIGNYYTKGHLVSFIGIQMKNMQSGLLAPPTCPNLGFVAFLVGLYEHLSICKHKKVGLLLYFLDSLPRLHPKPPRLTSASELIKYFYS